MKAVYIGNDPKIQEMALTALRLRWPDATLKTTGATTEGLASIEQYPPDVVLIYSDSDDMLLSQTIQDLRQFSNVPILVFAPKNDAMEVATALEAGADHCIHLPCGLSEVMMRVFALLRRTNLTGLNHQPESLLQSGDLLLNLSTQETFLGGQLLLLTATEFRLLRLLVRNRDKTMQLQTLRQAIRGKQTSNMESLPKCIQRLRCKLGDDARNPRWIASVHGVGYRFIGPAPAQTKTAEKIAG